MAAFRKRRDDSRLSRQECLRHVRSMPGARVASGLVKTREQGRGWQLSGIAETTLGAAGRNACARTDTMAVAWLCYETAGAPGYRRACRPPMRRSGSNGGSGPLLWAAPCDASRFRSCSPDSLAPSRCFARLSKPVQTNLPSNACYELRLSGSPVHSMTNHPQTHSMAMKSI